MSKAEWIYPQQACALRLGRVLGQRDATELLERYRDELASVADVPEGAAVHVDFATRTLTVGAS